MTPLAGSRILVPLDRSEAAEHALQPAMRIAQATGASLVLASITPLRVWATGGAGVVVSEDAYQRLVDEEDRVASDYLAHMAAEVSAHGVAAQTRMERGDPGDALLGLEERFQIGLVVMTTHGRTGMARVALGSVADRVVRGGGAPVLLTRPYATTFSDDTSLESALVPLDGSEISETALAIVEQLAGTLLRYVTLLRVVSAAEFTGARMAAREYLDAQRLKLLARVNRQDRPSCAVTAVVETGSAMHSILVRASHHHDLIIMATRGQTGMRRLAVGSVADGVMHDTPVPLLLTHPASQTAERGAYEEVSAQRLRTP